MAARRIEGLAGDQAVFDLLQRMTDRSLQRQGSRRRLHGPADAHQQRVIEQLAQATQGIAHRRLAEGQALGGTRDVALTQQGVEHAKQVQVEVVDIHLVNPKHHKTKFQK